MTKARILADFISDGSPLADGTLSVAEVTGAAPLASPTFTGTVTATSLDISGDIDVDGITNLDVVDIDGAVNMASTLQVTGTANFSDRIGSTYVFPTDAYGQTAGVTNYFWKMGRITIIGPQAAEIKLYGLQGYGQGDPIVGTNIIQLRGSNSATVLDGCFHAIGDAGIGIQEMRYVPIGGYVFDLYVKLGPYFSLSTTVVSGGTWVPEWTNTGSGSNPASSVDIPAQYALVLGSTLPMHANLTEVAFNDYSNNVDFRVESDANATMLFMDAGLNTVCIGHGGARASLALDVQGDIGQTWADGERFIGQQYSTGAYRMGIITDSNDRTAQLVANAGDSTGKLEFYTNSNRAGLVSSSNDWTFFEGVTINENGNDNDFRVESDTNTHALFVDASANAVMVGTSAVNGTTANYTPIIAGTFSTQRGTASNLAYNTWITLHTFPAGAGNFIVTAIGGGTGNIADNTTGIVHVNATVSSYADLLLGTNVDLRMSGLSLQVYQSIFTGANINWSVMRIG